MSLNAPKDSRSLYHRWRSRSFSEVVGQDHVTRTLRNAVASGRIVHAYLFCGPRGTGKTSTARILAKAVNCLDPRDGEPCNSCASCMSVAEGRALDLIEIDAASNRGIDDARDLREKIKYSPGESRYKVYIIDEAHMLTSEASNALLKTLEEPPEHAILILATTESHKILATISSRCQRFDFRRIPQDAIIQQLRMICESEGIRPQAGVLERVARMARGSLRDAESLLDQLVAYCGDDLDLPSARDVLGLTGEEAIPMFADALRRADMVQGFQLIDGAASAGADLRHFSRELVDYLRALMVVRSGADTNLVREMRSEEVDQLRSSARLWQLPQLLQALRTFGDLEGRLRQEAFNQMQLEIAFMEAILSGSPEGGRQEGSHVPASEAPRSAAYATPGLPTSAAPLRPGRQAPPFEAPREVTPQGTIAASDERLPEDDGTLAGSGSGAESLSVPASVPSIPRELAPTIALDFASLQREWPRIARELQAAGGFIFMPLGLCRPVQLTDNTAVLGFEGTGMRHSVEKPAVRERVEEVLSQAFGIRVAVKFKYGVKFTREAVPPERDAVVDAAMREFGFTISRTESVSE